MKNIVLLVFIAVGIGMLYLAFSLHVKTNHFLTVAQLTDGKVIRLVTKRSQNSNSYSPEVEFTSDDGQLISFVSSSSSNPPSYSVGEQVSVLYDPQSPYTAQINSFFSLRLGEIISGVMGLCFTLSFSYLLVRTMKRQQRLRDFGQIISAKVNNIEKSYYTSSTARINNTYASVRQTTYWVIHAQWQNPRNQKLYLFESEKFYFDPGNYVKDSINVRIDPDDPKIYEVETGFIPKMG